MKIRLYPDPVLTTKCEPVTEFDSALSSVLDEMQKVMADSKGMGLSANQVGISKRFFIMKDKKEKVWEFINPEILETEGYANLFEGCLSAPNVYDRVLTRANSVTVKAQDRNGQEFQIVAEGIEAVCIQHEYDHLEGVFWFSKLPSRQVRKGAEKRWEKERKKLHV